MMTTYRLPIQITHAGSKSWVVEFRKESSKKVDLGFCLSIYERILCLIFGFSRNTDSARFKALLTAAPPKFNSRSD